MRIIKSKEEKIAKCESCKSTLAYISEDVNIQMKDFFGAFYYYKYVNCPICGSRIYV